MSTRSLVASAGGLVSADPPLPAPPTISAACENWQHRGQCDDVARCRCHCHGRAS